MEHQEFFEKVSNFRCYENLWYGKAKTFLSAVKKNEACLAVLLTKEEVELFAKYIKEQRDPELRIFLGELYERYIGEAVQICRQMLKSGQLAGPKEFISGINTLLNISPLLRSSEADYLRLMLEVREVLALYPNYGYVPDEDDLFEEKIFDNSLIIRREAGGDAEIRLREAEVIALENWKRSRKQ